MKNLHEQSWFKRVWRIMEDWFPGRKKQVIEHDCFKSKYKTTERDE